MQINRSTYLKARNGLEEAARIAEGADKERIEYFLGKIKDPKGFSLAEVTPKDIHILLKYNPQLVIDLQRQYDEAKGGK